MEYTEIPHLTYALIDLDALAHNITVIKQHVGDSVEIFGVVKANAYGHGSVQCARVLLKNGANALAVARVDEGIQLRQAGINAPILVLNYALPVEIPYIVQHDLMPTINTLVFAKELAAQVHGEFPYHVKIDTGMGRYGQLPHEILGFLQQLERLPNLKLDGVYTHFATADEADRNYTEQQLTVFNQVRDEIIAAGINVRLWHTANSGGTLAHPDAYHSAVRPGVALYGLPPSNQVDWPVELKPALSLHSHVARVRMLPAGSSIGYGRTYVAQKAIRVALVPIGYGDGYRRALSNKGKTLIHGQFAPIVGRVSMDQIIVDVSHIDNVAVNDPVVLIGQQGEQSINADDIAQLLGTINYEVTTALLPRVTRVYRQGEDIIEAVRIC